MIYLHIIDQECCKICNWIFCVRKSNFSIREKKDIEKLGILFYSVITKKYSFMNDCNAEHFSRENVYGRVTFVFFSTFRDSWTVAESIYYDSLKVSKSKCQFIWREWRGGNGGALFRGLQGPQRPSEAYRGLTGLMTAST